jgi:hypothetical protein
MGREDRASERQSRISLRTNVTGDGLHPSPLPSRTSVAIKSVENDVVSSQPPRRSPRMSVRDSKRNERTNLRNSTSASPREQKLSIGSGTSRFGDSSAIPRIPLEDRDPEQGTAAAYDIAPASEPGVVPYRNDGGVPNDGNMELDAPSTAVSSALTERTDVFASLTAQLATEEDEEFRKLAEEEAEANILASVREAVVVEKYPTNERRRKRILLCSAAVLILIIVGVVVGVILGANGSDDQDAVTGSFPPTLQPSAKPEVDPDNSRDSCEDALKLLPASTGQLIFASTINATVKDDLRACSPLRGNGKGVWFKISGIGKTMSASTCTGTRFDTQLSIFAGSCGRLECVKANDQRFGCGNGDQSNALWFSEPDLEYFILVHGVRSADGVFGLSLELLSDNDSCSEAIRFNDFDRNSAIPVSVFGSTARGRLHSDLQQCGDVPYTAQGVWFVFEAKLSGFVQTIVQDFNSRITVFSGDCGNLQCVAASNLGMVLFTPEVGKDYFVYVHGRGDEIGDFSLSLGRGGALVRNEDGPVNINCDSALPLIIDGSKTTTGSTAVGGEVANVGSCGRMVYSTAPGLWYNLTGNDNWITVSTCATTSGFDSQISVFGGSCQNLECISGGDQECGDQSSVSWYSGAGEQYFILVHGRESRVGEFNLTVEEAILGAADECDAAIGPLPSKSLATLGTWTNARFSDIGRCGEVDVAGPSVWYTVIGDGKELIASTCGVSLSSGARITVFTGTCDNLLCVDSAASSNCGEQMWVSWDSNVNELYYILVYGSTGSQGHSFELKIDEAPSNLRCTDTTAEFTVSTGMTIMGVTEVALSEDETFCKQGPAADLGSWYSFVGESDSRFTISACSEFTDFQIQLSVFVGDDCNNLECIGFNNGISCGSGSPITWDAVRGQNYYILAQGSPSTQISGNFALTVGSENDLCATAIGPLPTDDSVTMGSTAGATSDSQYLGCFSDGGTISAPGVWYFVEGAGSLLKATTCVPETDLNFDTKISVYQGESCDQLSCMVANDNDCGKQSRVSWFAEEGEAYYILIHGYSTGDFGLAISVVSNDSCDSAYGNLPTDGSTMLGSTVNSAVATGVDSCTVDMNSSSLPAWYSFEGTGSNVTVDTCAFPGFESQLSILKGDCSDLQCVSFEMDECLVTFPSTYTQEYRVLVSGLDPFGDTYAVAVDSNNNQCQNALGPLSIGDVVRGSTVTATTIDVGHCDTPGLQGAGVWYSFMGKSQNVTAFTCSAFADAIASRLSVFAGDCDDLTCVGMRSGRCGRHSWMTWLAEEGRLYRILVSGIAESSVGNFQLSFQ